MFHEKGPSVLELAHQALSSTIRGYDLLAEKFDYTPFRTDDVVLEAVARVAGEDGPVESALDVCCGTGAVMSALRPHCTERVIGIDLSGPMLAKARENLAEAPGEANVEFMHGDVFEMDFDREFDVATCCGALGHILPDQQDAFVERIRAALKPGGRFLFVTRPDPPLWSPTSLACRGFNAAMHVRNALIDPPFIMFYLKFTVERAREVLERHGFDIELRESFELRNYESYRLVVATRN